MSQSEIRNPKSEIIGAALFALVVPLLLCGCSKAGVEVNSTRLVSIRTRTPTAKAPQGMDVEVAVRAIAPTDAIARAAVEAAWKEMETCLARLDPYHGPSNAWLHNDPEALHDPAQCPSDLWLINDSAGKAGASVDPLVTACLASSKEVFDKTLGAFDPSAGALFNLWDNAEAQGREPDEKAIAKARTLPRLDKIEIGIDTVQNPKKMGIRSPESPPPKPQDIMQVVHTIGLPVEGMRLDPRGIIKGFVASRMTDKMRQAGAMAGLVSIAGAVSTFGEQPYNLVASGADRRWSYSIPDPRDPTGSTTYTSVHLKEMGAATGGNCYRTWHADGKSFSRIIDPKTGRPVSSPIISITVVAADSGIAEALTSAIAVMGRKAGMALLEEYQMECLVLEVGPPEGSPEGTPPPPPDASGAVPKNATIIAYRSSGFANLEIKPDGK
jgi:thiamine biosynthesis lipoprotein ApbE